MVFEKYFRVPGDANQGGSGLGLAIVREIITAHGGTVECESHPGVTTVFRMSLPVWTGETAQSLLGRGDQESVNHDSKR
jgi:signal transduction histidine kinase